MTRIYAAALDPRVDFVFQALRPRDTWCLQKILCVTETEFWMCLDLSSALCEPPGWQPIKLRAGKWWFPTINSALLCHLFEHLSITLRFQMIQGLKECDDNVLHQDEDDFVNGLLGSNSCQVFFNPPPPPCSLSPGKHVSSSWLFRVRQELSTLPCTTTRPQLLF